MYVNVSVYVQDSKGSDWDGLLHILDLAKQAAQTRRQRRQGFFWVIWRAPKHAGYVSLQAMHRQGAENGSSLGEEGGGRCLVAGLQRSARDGIQGAGRGARGRKTERL